MAILVGFALPDVPTSGPFIAGPSKLRTVGIRLAIGDAAATRRYGLVLAASLLVFLASLYVAMRDPFGRYAVAEPACQPPHGELALRADLQAAADKETELRLQLAQLSTDAGSRRLICPPVQPTAQPAAQPAAPPRSADENRAQQRGAHRGKLAIILAWEDRNDLDLHIRCPAGNTISFEQPNVCGGQPDVDSNNDHVTASAESVENVFFSDPQPGAYRILVDPAAMRVARSTPFRLTIQQDGRPDRVITGTANNGAQRQEVATVTVDARP